MKRGTSKTIVRIIPVILLVILGAVIAFFLLPRLYAMEGATTQIAMLRTNVTAGTMIEENMVTSVTVGAYGLDPTVIKDPTSLVGKYAEEDTTSKDLLFPENFSDIPLSDIVLEKDPEIELAQNERLLTLQLSSIAAGAAGHILPGDIVDTAVYKENDDNTNYYQGPDGTVTTETESVLFPEELQGITVYRVQTANLTTVDPTCNPLESNVNERVPTYITLICTQEQADLLIEYSYSHTVHFLEHE